MFALPGGHLEYGEEPTDCGIREVLEETNLKLKSIKLGTMVSTVMKDINRHYITLFMVAELV